MSQLRQRKAEGSQPPDDAPEPEAKPPQPEIQPLLDDPIYEETSQGKLRNDQHERDINVKASSPKFSCSLGVVVFCFSFGCCLFAWFLCLPEDAEKKVFHPTALAMYNGENRNPMYIAILGQVFDVTKARHYYGKGEGYNVFVGRDASKAFITGEFDKDKTDDVSGLTDEQLLGLVGWRDFYHKKYSYKGRVAGSFYDYDGNELPALKAAEAAAARGKAAQEEAERNKVEEVYPQCDSRWSEEEGGFVSCPGDMYPRKIHKEGSGPPPTWRCACFEELGWSDLRQVYEDCDPDAHECQISPPSKPATPAA